jgi:AraC-like DNA-binding protein
MRVEYSPVRIDGGFDISFASRSGSYRMDCDHYHEYFEFFLFLGGAMRYFVRDRSYAIGRNGIVFVGPNDYHHSEYTGSGVNERLLVMFDEGLFVLAGGEAARRRVAALFRSRAAALPPEAGARVAGALLRGALPEFERRTATGRLRAALRIVDTFLELAELEDEGALADVPPVAARPGGKIPDIVNYINENYAGRITLGDVAAAFYTDKYYLCHIFKQSTGLGILEFTNRKRLMEAERRLRATRRPVTDIAMEVGFNNTNHFTELFKRMYGATPGEYRKSAEDKSPADEPARITRS